jgi:hypothetical protein
MFTACDGRFLVRALVAAACVLAVGSATLAGEVIKLTKDDGKKPPPGKTRPIRKLHLDDSVVVTLAQHPSLGLQWVASDDSSKFLEVKTGKPEPNKSSHPIGVGGSVDDVTYTFRFKPAAASKAASTNQPQYLRLKLVRGRSTKAIDTWEVPIQVVK